MMLSELKKIPLKEAVDGMRRFLLCWGGGRNGGARPPKRRGGIKHVKST